VVIRLVIGDQRNLPNSSFKQGSFRLGELSRISMFIVSFCMICDEIVF